VKFKEDKTHKRVGAYNDKSNGIRTSHWFWGAADTFKPKPTGDSDQTSGSSADEDVRKLLVENPQANAATLYNMIKAKGLKIVKATEHAALGVDKKKFDDCVNKVSAKGNTSNAYAVCNASLQQGGSTGAKKKKRTEADSASANTQMLPAGAKGVPKKKPKTESSQGNISWTAKFKESSAVDDGIGHTKFEVALITEGLGNFKDAFYYDREALESAIPIFEGAKIYADHPSLSEEEDRPERSVRDILGHYQDLRIQEKDDGCGELLADLVTLPDKSNEWARTRIKHAAEYAKKFPDKDFVGLSINASGDAMEKKIDDVIASAPEGAKIKLQEAKDSGIETIRVVSEIKDAVSCDLVTEAGAGGRIINLIEGENMATKKGKVKNREAAADGEHDDAAQDMELIKKMLDEYVGKADGDDGHSNETMKMAYEAYEAYKEMGHKEEEAMKMAGSAMKLAKHMAGKKEAAETDEADEAEESDEADADGKKKPDENQECGDEKDGKMKKMESEMLRLKGRLALVEADKKKSEAYLYMEDKLAKSKQPNSITKAFREAAKGKIKSKEDVDSQWQSFANGVEAQKQGEAVDNVFFTEKGITASDETENGGILDFSTCADNY